MKTEESFYVQILLWAYEKTAAGTGFTESELEEKFDLKNNAGDKHKLYLKLFRDGTSDNHPVIDHFYNKHSGLRHDSYFCLSDKGMASAIDYIDLKEARESSATAKEIAFWSIGIAIVVGILQIIIALLQLSSNY